MAAQVDLALSSISSTLFAVSLASLCAGHMTTLLNAVAEAAPIPLNNTAITNANGGIIARSPSAVYEKLRMIKAGGAANLQVITDFDRTLTMHMVNGKEGLTSHGVVESSGVLGEDYHTCVTALKRKYYPMEIDPTLDYATKYRMMDEWWDQAHSALIASGINKNDIPSMVAKSGIALREGIHDMFESLSDANVPLLVFSAGLGDILAEVLRQEGLMVYDNVHLVSNFMTFDDAGRIKGFKGKNIHVLNKCETSISGTRYADDVRARHNVILMGDSLGDLQMSKGVHHENILRIGFLNDKIEERLDAYAEAFDIVILNDGNLDLVNRFIDDVLAPSGPASTQ
eukprot:comp22220_c0_seq2/m.32730 comp22220_c0_seq2/g.32730  ORF comp22220_c0_seq2/g.32730 comp22220_c0_seq2/m.32730 type:complete len:342 (-) comp22220_c0_seq2:891-1916(-)